MFNSYKLDEAFIETQTGNRIKVVRSDRGREFLSNEMTNHQDQRGTIREFTVHDSPLQNGVAERGMRTCAEQAHALLIASGLPHFLWEEAMRHTTWLQNRTPACALNGKTPYEVRHNKKPFLGGIQEFGVAAYVKDLKAGKLDSRAQLGRFVGYDSESKGYRIFWPLKGPLPSNETLFLMKTTYLQNTLMNLSQSEYSPRGREIKSSSTLIVQAITS